MRKFIDTEQVQIKTLLEDENRYIIPKFQREYSWEDEHVETFLADLLEHFDKEDKTPYFFGTIVLIDVPGEDETWKIVDGQQRMSTSLIFLSVIRDILNELGKDYDAEKVNEFIQFEDSPPDPEYPYRLRLSKNNEDFFKNHVLKPGEASKKAAIDVREIAKRNKSLAVAYKIIFDNLHEKLAEIPESDEKIRFLIKLYNHFLKFFVVVRNTIDSPDRAYRIFDSINNRGIALEESDLVKNYLLETIDHGKGDVDTWHEKWLEILQKIDFARVKEGLFLRHYMMAYYGPTDAKRVFKRVSDKIQGREQAETFIDKLYEAATLYRRLKDPDPSDWFNDQKILDNLLAFTDLDAKVVYPVLLKGFSVFGTSKKAFSELIEILLIFFFRSRTICKTSATALENLMNKVCEKLRVDTSVTVSDIKEILKSSTQYPSNEKFVFNFSIFDANSRNALYILINLNEEMHGGREHMTLSAVKNIISIEHIMPKTIKDSDWEKYLIEELGLQNADERSDYHLNNLWRIGNLTILNKSKNFRAQNSSFLDKYEMAYKDDNAKITKHLEQWKEWDTNSISARQKILAGTAKLIWTLDS
ncbi:MAG: DUF262 domain-containing protein [Thaumarchaeota archaeon]|nr:DUF262 domain-containing protein [Nitrososphaerota archaeon]